MDCNWGTDTVWCGGKLHGVLSQFLQSPPRCSWAGCENSLLLHCSHGWDEDVRLDQHLPDSSLGAFYMFCSPSLLIPPFTKVISPWWNAFENSLLYKSILWTFKEGIYCLAFSKIIFSQIIFWARRKKVFHQQHTCLCPRARLYLSWVYWSIIWLLDRLRAEHGQFQPPALVILCSVNSKVCASKLSFGFRGLPESSTNCLS